MKYLILILLFFLLFWYYKRRKAKQRETGTVEMKPCMQCGVYFPENSGLKDAREEKTIYFCSRRCLREYLELGRGEGC
ncbi:MAG: hypothetical protein RMI93_03200 [Caldimicrobium sp.]|nr:hypothetical protein [Caldimicrobium sp.]MDW8182596.1 hypothetical protein [Caldimicrobium sp.]